MSLSIFIKNLAILGIRSKVARPILQSVGRVHSDSVGTWSQTLYVITVSRTAHGIASGEYTAFYPTAGTGTLATAGTYLATVVDANTLTLTSTTSSTGTGTMLGTAEQTVFTGTIPGGIMGANGTLIIHSKFGISNTANAKTWKHKLNSTVVAQVTSNSTAAYSGSFSVQNNNSEEIQLFNSAAGGTTTFGGLNASGTGFGAGSAENTAADVTFSITVTKATGTDAAYLASLVVILIPTL